MKLPKILGKALFIICYPAIRMLILNSHRVYLAIICDNQILLTKNWLGLHSLYRLPGGGLHKNEPAKQGLIRECQEEIGVIINPDDLGIIGEYKSKLKFKYSLFLYQPQLKPVLNINNIEILQADWVSIDSLSAYELSEELKPLQGFINRSKI